MDGFCWQGELDLTLFYKIEGYFDNLESLMTLMTGNKITRPTYIFCHVHIYLIFDYSLCACNLGG